MKDRLILFRVNDSMCFNKIREVFSLPKCQDSKGFEL